MSEILSMTKLEAVNEMLYDMKARPVSSITGNSRLDVTRAEATLDRVTREVCQQGWWFNREERTLTPDASGQYLIASNLVRIDEIEGLSNSHTGDATTGSAPNFVIRVISGVRKLINTVDQVSTGYTDTLTVDAVLLLEFEQLPQLVRQYIYAAASVVNVRRAIGNGVDTTDLRTDAATALGFMRAEEISQQDFRLRDSPRNFELVHGR